MKWPAQIQLLRNYKEKPIHRSPLFMHWLHLSVCNVIDSEMKNIKMDNKHFFGIWFCSLMNKRIICASIDFNKKYISIRLDRLWIPWSNRHNIAMWDKRLEAKQKKTHSKLSHKRSPGLIRSIHSWSGPIGLRLLLTYET